TVGVVTWSTTLASPTSAQIDFGLDTTYGMTAPVSAPAASNNKTLLLGMKASKTYHYRITATNSSGSCASSDYTIMTGPQPNGLAAPTITTNKASALYGGFLVTGQYTMGATGAYAFILDKDGSYVWWYTVSGSDATGVAMSYDGQYMWIASANVPDATSTDHVHRVSMDGTSDTDFTKPFAHHSHQVTPLPDGSVAFYATGTNGCDDIKLFPANGTASSTATTVTNAKTAHGGSGACHVNNIQYSPMDDTLVFSDLDNNCLTKVTKTGTMVWVLNGGVNGVTSSFNGGGLVWKGGEHGFDILGDGTDLVIFNNNSTAPAGSMSGWGSAAGDESGSIAVEVKLDLTAKTATQTWMYKANPALKNDVLGDVQRLPNGNTIVDYATKGTIQEVDSTGALLQQIKTQTNFGYIEKRATLYGPPPR
ncbi:MAG TPA: aryl-sulfate sulfotransferase, partial [Polyangia bacterium]|nr:aryl-sulfate sulfotransferase [Polyangia bacterium]